MESNIDVEMKYINGEIEVELIPAGTLSEKIRSGGVGIYLYIFQIIFYFYL